MTRRLGACLAAAACLSLGASPVALAQDAAEGTAAPAIYQPADEDERGLWLQMDEYERDRAASPLVIRDEALNRYVNRVMCRTVGEAQCANVRIYIIRTPYFNASAAPNGMIEVWSGLLLRMENEAQLAAVLGHEYAHYERLHSVALFRDARAKSNAASWLSFVPFGFVASIGLMGSIFSFSREMEREADMASIGLLANAGYDTGEASRIWRRLRDEMDATAAARDTKSRKDNSGGIFATHPPSAERVADLTKAAETNPGVEGATGEAEYRAALEEFWDDFVDDQLKMNDFGASDFLLQSLAGDKWTPQLLYARGELYRRRGTQVYMEQAAGFYSQGIESGGNLAQLWRGRGLVRFKLGDIEAGKSDLREYVRRAPDAPDAPMMAMQAGVQE